MKGKNVMEHKSNFFFLISITFITSFIYKSLTYKQSDLNSLIKINDSNYHLSFSKIYSDILKKKEI